MFFLNFIFKYVYLFDLNKKVFKFDVFHLNMTVFKFNMPFFYQCKHGHVDFKNILDYNLFWTYKHSKFLVHVLGENWQCSNVICKT